MNPGGTLATADKPHKNQRGSCSNLWAPAVFLFVGWLVFYLFVVVVLSGREDALLCVNDFLLLRPNNMLQKEVKVQRFIWTQGVRGYKPCIAGKGVMV